MKRIISVVLLVLLLYNMFSTGIALLCFNEHFSQSSPIASTDEWIEVKIPVSLPYTGNFEHSKGKDGLLRVGNKFYNITEQKYENDTLYTRLKTNTNARDTFAALSEKLQAIVEYQQEHSSSPLSKALQSLQNLLTVYLNPCQPAFDWQHIGFLATKQALPHHYVYVLCNHYSTVKSPPPEFS